MQTLITRLKTIFKHFVEKVFVHALVIYKERTYHLVFLIKGSKMWVFHETYDFGRSHVCFDLV